MDFVVEFPRTRKQNDSICDIVDRLTKSAHFIPGKSTLTVEDYARIYIDKIVSLHGIPLSIIPDIIPNSLIVFGRLFKRV